MAGTIVLGLLGLVFAVFWIYGERGVPLRPSTWRTRKSYGWKRNLNLTSLHGYVYGRWIKEYINLLVNQLLPRLSPEGRKWWAECYHGKVLTPELAKAIITLDHNIPLKDLEQIIPYSQARELVLNGPPEVAVFQCACRQNQNNPCQPLEACMVIGQPFVDFILDHHPKTSRRLSQTEALEFLQAEHERGHLHSAWFKDAMLGRFYAICNCCKCCCQGIKVMNQYGDVMSSSGFVAEVEDSKCVACATCEEACPFLAITVNGHAQVAWKTCMGCGVCVDRCPNDAITLQRDEAKGLPLDARMLTYQEENRSSP
jgi:Pyruvate/2-oxoacid:ferredoxin oxidoreductase delta subunit